MSEFCRTGIQQDHGRGRLVDHCIYFKIKFVHLILLCFGTKKSSKNNSEYTFTNIRLKVSYGPYSFLLDTYKTSNFVTLKF